MKVILDLCSGSGAWSAPYDAAGYSVQRIDINDGNDVRDYKIDTALKVHGILAGPPCTHFAGSGARHWKTKGIQPLRDGLSIVDACVRIIHFYNPVWWVLENPVGRLRHYIGPPKMYFDPCDYGDAYTKKTCLWGRFNKPIKTPVEPVRVCNQGSWIQKLGGKSVRTKRLRSITPEGFSRAFFDANP